MPPVAKCKTGRGTEDQAPPGRPTVRVIELCPAPRVVVWDITYACPLRCSHCYSESGRRSSRELSKDDLYRVTDALIASSPMAVVLSGGEPLIVKEIFGVARRLQQAGIRVILYTSGWGFTASMLSDLTTVFAGVTVSVDGADAKTHDCIRGRHGSFERAMQTLESVDDALAAQRRRGERGPELGIDFVVMQSNFRQLREFCATIPARFPQLSRVCFGAVIPTGLASRESFAERELLSEEQMALLISDTLLDELRSLVTPSVEVSVTDIRRFQMHPDLMALFDIPPIQIEPDGHARAMPIYEGTVGSLLHEPLARLWERAIERWSDPLVVATLRQADSPQAWAAATRRIDLRFGSRDDRARIARRPPYAES